MNPYVILAVVLAWGASVGGAFWYGTGVGKDGEIANQAENKQLILDAREQAQLGAADAIAQIKVRNTTVQGKVETLVRENVVYRDCKHDDVGLLIVNEALTGNRPQPAGGSKLPRTDAPER